MGRGLRAAGLIAAPFLVWGAAAVGIDGIGASMTPASADQIVVLGCRVAPDGGPSPCLAGRTDAALAAWRAGVAPEIVVTGGTGAFPPAEAQVARARLVAAGVPSSAILVEDRSTSTFENAQFAAKAAQLGRVVVVTDTFHLWRGARCFGFVTEVVGGIPVVPTWDRRIPGALREVVAVVWYGWNGRL